MKDPLWPIVTSGDRWRIIHPLMTAFPIRLPVVLALCALASMAQAAPPSGDAARGGSIEDDASHRSSLRDQVGVGYAKALLVASRFEDRLRGLERLGRNGDRESLEALLDAVDGGGPIVQDPRTRLAAARALAPHAATESGRRGLEAILAHGLEEDVPRALGELARETAALALARAAAGLVLAPPRASSRRSTAVELASPAELALTPLLAAVIGGSALAPVAERAVVRHPPFELGAFVRGVATATVAEVRLLGKLRDPRAIPMLRRALSRSEPAIRLQAGLALARLGDLSALAELRRAAAEEAPSREGAAARASLVLAEALLVVGAPDATKTLAPSLLDPMLRGAALDLVEAFPSSAFVVPLVKVLEANPAPDEARRIVELLARIGGDASLTPLFDRLDEPTLGPWVGTALVRVEAPGADARLVSLLAHTSPSLRLAGLRLCAARLHTQGLRESGRDDVLLGPCRRALESAAVSSEPVERGAGVHGLVLLGLRGIDVGVASADPVVRAATISAAASRPSSEWKALLPAARRALASNPDGSEDSVDAAALALALLAEPALGSSLELARLAESGSLASVQAAYRLATRDPLDARARLDALLSGTDPLVRAHVALGLGSSPEANALARLESAYAFEPEVEVRRAIVRAVARRGEHGRERVLRLAAELEPDAEARRLAVVALAGPMASDPAPRSPSVLVLMASHRSEQAALAGWPVLLLESGRVARPALGAPDGVVLAFGVSDAVAFRPLRRSR
jgi:HEAT repeat protein